MGGLHVHIAVTHIQHAAVRLYAKRCHQRPRALGGGLCRYVGHGTAHDFKQAGVKIPGHHRAGKLVRFVGEHGHPHPGGFQPGQQCRYAGVGRRLVVHMHAVYFVKLGQRGGQLGRAAAVGGAEPLHQLGDAVAHKVAVFGRRVLGPAVGRANPVGRVGQIVDGIQKCAVQIKQYGFIHFPKPLCTRNHSYYSCI